MMETQDQDCTLCVQPATIIGLGQCNHKLMCYVCIIKMRTISKNKTCPICKQTLDRIILTDKLNANFQDFQLTQINLVKNHKDNDLYYDTDDVRIAVEQLNQIRCFVADCKQHGMAHQNLNQLKTHLRNDHLKYLCDICLESKTCVLKEQTLYTEYTLRRHQNNGDVDEDGNVIFFHPFCKFCSRFFYDEDKFKLHLNQAHINCNLCQPQAKYKYYKDHASFERHLRFTHYLCEEPLCRDSLVVFHTQGELETHNQKVHSNDPRVKKITNQKNLQLTGFYDDPKQQQQRQSTQQDNEGWEFEDQFISLQKTKMRSIGGIDEHKDEVIDIREFFNQDYNDEFDRKLDYSEKDVNQRKINFEDLHLIKPATMPSLHFDAFLKKCFKFTKEEDKIRNMVRDLENEKYNVRFFVEDFIKYFGPKTGFRLLQFYLHSKDMRDPRMRPIAKQVDEVIYQELLKLPRTKTTMIFNSAKYSDYFKNVQNVLDENLKIRIEKGILTKFKDTLLPKERIFQLVEILRHVRTQDMGKLKFALHFGIGTNTLDYIRSKILNEDVKVIQSHLLEISNQEFLPFYLYISLCLKILTGRSVHQEKDQINKCVYHEMFEKNQELLNKLQHKTGDSDEEERKIVKQGKHKNKQRVCQDEVGYQINQYEFPSLATKQKQQQQQSQVAAGNTAWNNTSVLLVQGTKQAVEDEFPTLDKPIVSKKQQPQQSYQQKQVQQQYEQQYQQQQQTQKPQKQQIQQQVIQQEAEPVKQQVKQKPKQQQQLPTYPQFGGKFELDDTFEPLEGSGNVPVKSLEGTDWDDNPIIPKKNPHMKEVGRVVKKGKVKVMISGGFY